MSFVPGEIVLAAFPFSDLSGSKRRPCVVLAVADTPDEFVVTFITSKAARATLNSAVLIEPSHPQLSVRQQCELLELNRSSFSTTSRPQPTPRTRG